MDGVVETLLARCRSGHHLTLDELLLRVHQEGVDPLARLPVSLQLVARLASTPVPKLTVRGPQGVIGGGGDDAEVFTVVPLWAGGSDHGLHQGMDSSHRLDRGPRVALETAK